MRWGQISQVWYSGTSTVAQLRVMRPALPDVSNDSIYGLSDIQFRPLPDE